MNELLGRILDAHGGMDRWNGYTKVDATMPVAAACFRSRECHRIQARAA
jgi:hypothetical protein